MVAIPRDETEVRPLAELPSLVLDDASQDLRGWTVYGADGRPLGTVLDLLVDVDRLIADVLVVSNARSTIGDTATALVVPVQALARDEQRRRLVPGSGVSPLRLRYRSTVVLSLWAAVAATLALAAAWAFELLEW